MIAEKQNKNLTKDFDEFYDYFGNITEDKNITKNDILKLDVKASELYSRYQNLELTVKKDANSLYGTSANEYFSLKDYDVSTDITMAGKHSTVMIDVGINEFFTTWADDKVIVDKILEFYPHAKVVNNIYIKNDKNDICVYGDTDSRYLNLGKIYELINVEIPTDDKELADFSLFIMDNFINKLMDDIIAEDCAYRNAYPQYLKMTHEVTTRMCAFMGRKHYIMTLIWKDGKLIPRKLKFTGIELKKGSMTPRLKKIITVIVEKYFIKNLTYPEIKKEILGLFKWIITRQERSLVYRISTVNDLNVISKNSDNDYVSEKGHIQHKIALFWMNFIKDKDIYKKPFEGQKMNFYYDEHNNPVGVPDDVNIDEVKNLPNPNYVKMLKDIFIKNILKYITEYNTKDLNDKKINQFLSNIKDSNF